MMLDDVYGSDFDRFPLEQEAPDFDRDDLRLDWDESEIRQITSELSASRGSAD